MEQGVERFSIEDLRREIGSLASDENYAVNFVDCVFRGALRLAASDLHLECLSDSVSLKMRFDGILHGICSVPGESKNLILTRIKYLSKLAVYQVTQPQDGRLAYQYNGYKVDLRTSFLPTVFGEKAVIRFPEQNQAELDIERLGMSGQVKQDLLAAAEGRQGLILLTGPSSSGKTTTIYSLLKYLYSRYKEGVNIATIEDPVERTLGFLSQTQLNLGQDITYSRGLKSILRQDPDIIMIGEIRDTETASIAVQAALTGHLIISTIHSNSATGVFLRLLHIDIEPFLIASGVRAALSQRLIRRLCDSCKREASLDKKMLSAIGSRAGEDAVFYAPTGCAKCNFTGYNGRTGIFEIIRMSDDLEDLILSRAPVSQFNKYIKSNNIKGLFDDAVQKAAEGITSIEEAMRVCSISL